MPRFYFHFTDGVRGYRDLKGRHYPGILSALKDAQERAEELVALLPRHTQREGWRIAISDQSGAVLAEVWLTAVSRIAEAIRRLEAEQQEAARQFRMVA